MSSDSLKEFLQANPEHPLLPQISYSIAVALFRENKLDLAKSELESFISKYKYSYLDSLIVSIYDSDDDYFVEGKSLRQFYLGLGFWQNVQKQLENIEELIKIRNQPISDKRLYKEGVFWFENQLAAYNFLWRGQMKEGLSGAMPQVWEGQNTTAELVITSDLVKKVSSTYETQLGWLKSAQTFQQLLESYPNSKFAARAKYSIGLNYYTLADGNVYIPTFDKVGKSWTARTVEHFDEFVAEFPDSSMADDALLSIADIMSSSDDNDYSFPETPVQVLQRLLRDYPRSDRAKEAREILKNLEA